MSDFWRRCEACEFIGPERATQADWRAFHRACHHLGRVYAETLRLPQLVRWMSMRLTHSRVM